MTAIPKDCTEQRFLSDVASHEIHVLHDDGVHRHIRFKRPQTRCYSFDLITWPGYLCYTGDMGTFVFERLEDMFEFFRTDRVHSNARGDTRFAINPSYWGGKLQAIDCQDGYKNFSMEAFAAAVKDDFDIYTESEEGLSQKDKDDLWSDVLGTVLYAEDKCSAVEAIRRFRHHEHGDIFTDFEHDTSEYSLRFIWCCYALAWGIQKYDETKIQKEVT